MVGGGICYEPVANQLMSVICFRFRPTQSAQTTRLFQFALAFASVRHIGGGLVHYSTNVCWAETHQRLGQNGKEVPGT